MWLRLQFSMTQLTAFLTQIVVTGHGGLSFEKTVFAVASTTLAHCAGVLGACGNCHAHRVVKIWDME